MRRANRVVVVSPCLRNIVRTSPLRQEKVTLMTIRSEVKTTITSSFPLGRQTVRRKDRLEVLPSRLREVLDAVHDGSRGRTLGPPR
jgi:hypothetical protein